MDRSSREPFPSKRAVAWYLTALLIVAFGLRVWWASAWPNPSREWDERYSFENVHSLLSTGSLKPRKSFYPSPVFYLPPALAIVGARPFVDNPEAELFDPGRKQFGPTAYHLARGIQALFGTASLLLTYLLGAMLFRREVGLLAATVLAFVPWHVWVSGLFKPDAQVVFFVLVVLIAGARWMRSPSVLGALAVGAAVALATSSKVITAVAGVAFGLAALVRARGWRELGQIVLAGASSIGLFLVLTPYVGILMSGLDYIKWDYERRAWWAGMSKAEIPQRTLEYLLAPTGFGPLLGALALIGYVGLWVVGLRAIRSRNWEIAGTRLMLAVFPLLYVGLHTAQSAWFRGNNFTHILPPFALGCAWVVVALLDAAVRRLRLPRPILAAAILGLWVLAVPPGFLFVYQVYTPSTLDAGSRYLRSLGPRLDGRVVIVEPVEARGVPHALSKPLTVQGIAVVHARSAAELPEARRRQSDAEILRGQVPRARSITRGARRRIFRPKLGRLRGPTLTVFKHPWARDALQGPMPIRWAEEGELAVELPETDERQLVSIVITVHRPPGPTPDDSPAVLYGDLTVPLYRTAQRHKVFHLLSERFPAGGPGPREARIVRLPQLPVSRLRANVYVWSPPGEAAPASGPGGGR